MLLDDWRFVTVGAVVVGIVITIVAGGLTIMEAGNQQPEQQAQEQEAVDKQVHPSDVMGKTDQEVHEMGYPTKGDVYEWHMTGRWGYSKLEGDARKTVLYDKLPGGSEIWDEWYGLAHDNKAWKYI